MVNPNVIDLRAERGIERRRCTRYDYPTTVDYVVANDAAAKLHKAISRNISADGLGAYIFEPLHVGQKIIVKSKLPFDSYAGIVRWTKQDRGGLYEVGLQYEACSDRDAA